MAPSTNCKTHIVHRINRSLELILLGSISAALSNLIYVPPLRGTGAGSFPEQRLVIEPNVVIT